MIEPYYEKDGITIYHSPCEQVLPFLEPVDLVLTDPPYGIGEAKNDNKSRSCLAQSRNYGRADWDNSPPPQWVIESVRQKATTQILWGGNYYGLQPSSCWLVWDKDNGKNDFADCELAWTNMPKAVRKFVWRWQGMLQENGGDKKEHRQHPTQKPVPLMQWCLSLVDDAKTVLDPFMGSGTTLVAAKLAGIKCIGIEIEERYCEIAANRLAQKTLQFTD